MKSFLIEAVLFDLDDTLHDDSVSYHYASKRAAEEVALWCEADAEALRYAYITVAESFWQNLSNEHLIAKPVGLRRRMWTEAMRMLGINDPTLAERAEQAFNRYRKERLAVFPGVLYLLVSLRARGISLGFVT